MNKKINDILDWFTIENVCTELEANERNVSDLVESKKLNLFAKFNNIELLAVQRDSNKQGYIAKAKIVYSGYMKINGIDYFTTTQHMYAKRFSILKNGEVHTVIKENILPSFVPNSYIENWDSIQDDKELLDLEYLLFPSKEYVSTKNSPTNSDIKCPLSELDAHDLRRLENDDGYYEYIVQTDYLLFSEQIYFSKDEVRMLVDPNYKHREKITKMNLSWYLSLNKKSVIKRIIERLFLNNPNESSKNMWELLKNDIGVSSIYDQEWEIAKVTNNRIIFEGSNKDLSFKTFENYLSDCRRFYKSKLNN